MKTRYIKWVTIEGVVCQINLTRDFKSETKMVHNRIVHEDICYNVMAHRCEGSAGDPINMTVVVPFTNWNVNEIKAVVDKCEKQLALTIIGVQINKSTAEAIASTLRGLGFEQTMP